MPITDGLPDWATTLGFDGLALIFFSFVLHSLLRTEDNKPGVFTPAVLAVFCALMGNPDRFQTMKFSITGVETTARDAIQKVQITLQQLQKMEAAFAKANLNQLAMSGQLLSGIKTEDKFAIRDRIIESMQDIGLSKEEIRESQNVWIDVYCTMILDHIEGAVLRLLPNTTAQLEIEALPVDDKMGLPIPESLEKWASQKSLKDEELTQLLGEYARVWATGAMKNPALIPFNENMRNHIPTSPSGLRSGQTWNNGGIPSIVP